MIQVEWLLNGAKMMLAEFTDYVMHMTNSKVSVIKFMEKKISENDIGYVVLCYEFTKKSVAL